MLASYDGVRKIVDWMKTDGEGQRSYGALVRWARRRWNNVYLKDGRDVIRYLYNNVKGDVDVLRFMPIGWCGEYGDADSEREVYDMIVERLGRTVVVDGREVELVRVILEYMMELHGEEGGDDRVTGRHMRWALSVLVLDWAFGIWREAETVLALKDAAGGCVVVSRASRSMEYVDVDAIVVGADGVKRFVSIKSGKAFGEASLARYRAKSQKPDVYVSLVDGVLRYVDGSMDHRRFVQVLQGGQ